MRTHSSDAKLLSGSPDDFAALYRKHEDAVLAFHLRRVSSAETAADLTAETFARALEGRARFDEDRGEVRGWLFGIARNVLVTSLERGRVEDVARTRLGMEPLVLDDADLARIDELSGFDAEAALAALPEDQATAVRGRVLHEADYTQLASELECSESVARQRVSRGLRHLRTTLKELR